MRAANRHGALLSLLLSLAPLLAQAAGLCGGLSAVRWRAYDGGRGAAPPSMRGWLAEQQLAPSDITQVRARGRVLVSDRIQLRSIYADVDTRQCADQQGGSSGVVVASVTLPDRRRGVGATTLAVGGTSVSRVRGGNGSAFRIHAWTRQAAATAVPRARRRRQQQQQQQQQ